MVGMRVGGDGRGAGPIAILGACVGRGRAVVVRLVRVYFLTHGESRVVRRMDKVCIAEHQERGLIRRVVIGRIVVPNGDRRVVVKESGKADVRVTGDVAEFRVGRIRRVVV
jgi:hypothetical protein